MASIGAGVGTGGVTEAKTGAWPSAGTTGAAEPAWPTIAGNTVVDGTVTWRANTMTCRFAEEDVHLLLRYTPGPGVQVLFGDGTDVGSGVKVSGIGQNNDQYDNIDRHFTSSGHLAIVAKLSDGSQGAYLVTGPGTAPIGRPS